MALNERGAMLSIVVLRNRHHTELTQLETSKLMEVTGCINTKDRDWVVEDRVHIVQYATVGVPCSSSGTVVETERKEVQMKLKQLALKMRNAMKVRREVGILMKWAWLWMNEMMVHIDINSANVDPPDAV